MDAIDTVVVGAGQAGLAVSHCLTAAGREHVVLERGRPGARWRGRWQSQRLLTPNWMSRLPGWSYEGDDPDGFMTLAGFVDHLTAYAASFGAPVLAGSAVRGVTARPGGGYLVTTDRGTWRARNVVVAAGACDTPAVPAVAQGLAGALTQVHAQHYRGAHALPPGGVLVVGASSSGLQIADDANRAGRRVVVSVGSHRRAPRRYRGMDIWWWLERLGVLERRIEDMLDATRARREPSLQLAAGRDLDLGLLARRGVQLAGRLLGADGRRVGFADDLGATTAEADARLRRILRRIDLDVLVGGLAGEVLPAAPLPPVVPPPAATELDLEAAGIRTVVWATGYRHTYPWLRVPVRDGAGRIRQRGGVTPAPGLYVVGLPFLSRRGSHFIDGVRHDADAVVAHLCGAEVGQTPAGQIPGAQAPAGQTPPGQAPVGEWLVRDRTRP